MVVRDLCVLWRSVCSPASTSWTAWTYRCSPNLLFWCHPSSIGHLWDVSLVLHVRSVYIIGQDTHTHAQKQARREERERLGLKPHGRQHWTLSPEPKRLKRAEDKKRSKQKRNQDKAQEAKQVSNRARLLLTHPRTVLYVGPARSCCSMGIWERACVNLAARAFCKSCF